MANILLKRGTSTNFTGLNLKAGEPAFVTDLGKLYIGSGSQKVLINPIDKPVGINSSNFYTKVKVNEYGQVTAQASLISTDIPVIPSNQVSGLGTAANANTGFNSGNVPTLNVNGKLPDSVLSNPSFILAYFSGTNGTVVNANQIVPLTNYSANGTAFSFDSGTITINETGVYLISYTMSSNSLQLATALSYNVNGVWLGTYSRSSTTSIPAYANTGATIIKQVTAVPEKFAIKNVGTSDIVLMNGYGSLSIAKIK